MLKIYNTQTGKKEKFIPILKNHVSIYCCGPTVYNYFHIGNARAFLFFDLVRKYFNYLGFKTKYVQNITDIDDKIIDVTKKGSKSFKEISEKFTKAFFEDCLALGIDKADYTPKATQYVEKMVKFIQKLINKGNAYIVDGDVYFSIKSYKNYGFLSHKNMEQLLVGARVEKNENKKNQGDFVLWKKAKHGEPFWKTPWGNGRPGWHTECVVMSQDILGERFDIHAGGADLIFPHHENEKAQAECLRGKQFVNYWMHNGFLNIESKKMSKSLNNFFTTRDILKEYSKDTIRFFFLSKHYRSPIDFSKDIIQESERAINSLVETLKSVDYFNFQNQKIKYCDEIQKFKKEFEEAMDDDFNTAKAISTLFSISKKVKDLSKDIKKRINFAHLLYQLGSVLGFFQDLKKETKFQESSLSKKLIQLLIDYREKAKKDKNWDLADKIRGDLNKMGINLQDTKDGTIFF